MPYTGDVEESDAPIGQDEVDEARTRLGQLGALQAEGRFGEAVRESQIAASRALHGLLRVLGVEPSGDQDVTRLLVSRREHLPPTVARHLKDIRRIAKKLRGEEEAGGELAYDDADLDSATEAIELAGLVVSWVEAGMRELRGRAG